mmetsp:Transcript_15350/g.23339  ORF Transcript_15350/g.23339 Transcript_15350/m.23339 type:complete len:201 (-) Transcript_15350:1845-2447(-)
MMSSRFQFTILTSVLFLLGPLAVYGFQGSHMRARSLHQSVTAERFMSSLDDQDYMPLTPMQIKTLRKEVAKRRSRKQLPQEWLPELETIGPFSEETLTKILQTLEEEELMEIRGISKGEKRDVFRVSEELAYYLASCCGKDVERIDTKGHSSVFYCPGESIKLRTSYQPNQWSKRPRPLRNNSGQIIKSVREIQAEAAGE